MLTHGKEGKRICLFVARNYTSKPGLLSQQPPHAWRILCTGNLLLRHSYCHVDLSCMGL